MDKIFEVYHGQIMSKWVQEASKKRIDWICSNAFGTVLDIGCSQGIVPWILAQRGMQVTGIDISCDAIEFAKQQISMLPQEAQQKIAFHNTDFSQFDDTQKFDTIIAGEYLEHLDDVQLSSHLGKIKKLLSHNGKLIITTPLGLHPHPDHQQIFLPNNFLQKITPLFSVNYIDVVDTFIRCICTQGMDNNTISPEKLVELSEKGIVQIQKKYQSNYNPQKDNIESYITKEDNHLDSSLVEQLKEYGIEKPYTYDLKLFTALNTIYRSKPVVEKPRSITPKGLFTQADQRVDYLLKLLPDFSGLKCLELGCGRGETTVRLSERGNCHVTGVDVVKYREWEERWSKSTRFLPLDLTNTAPFPDGHFDFIFSFVVLEHVTKPLEMISVLHRLLKPGGKLYFTANLYRGVQASHRYREVFFPWPHLLFTDQIFEQYYKSQNLGTDGRPAWVNKLTHHHYLDHINKCGFEIKRCNFAGCLFDNEFYNCFYEQLSRYPIDDLEKDFIKLELVKKVS